MWFSELAYFFHFPTVDTTQVYFINLTYLSIKDQQGSWTQNFIKTTKGFVGDNLFTL